MAGSITYCSYTSDSGATYDLKLDESNSKGVALPGNVALTNARVVVGLQPTKSLKPRYVLCYSEANPLIKRRLVVGNTAAIPVLLAPGSKIQIEDYPGVADTVGTVSVFVVTYYSGEKSNVIPAVNTSGGDTGLTDGTPARDR
jgi:hypothetical protein